MANRTNTNTYTNPGRRRRRQPRWGRILGVLVALAVVIAAAALVPQMLYGGPQTDADAPTNASTPDGAQQQTPDGTPAQNGEGSQDAPHAAVGDGSLITLSSEEQTYLRAYTDAGFYYLTPEKQQAVENDACNIKYIDFATRQESYLCDRPDCTHDTPDCIGYVNCLREDCTLFAAYGHLILVGSFANENGEGEFYGIKMRDLDGKNEVTLVHTGDDDGIALYGLAADPDHIYYTALERLEDEKGRGSYTHVLKSVDIHTGEIVRVYELEDDDALCGTCGEYLLIRHVGDPLMDGGRLSVYAIDKQGKRGSPLYLPDPYSPDTHTCYYTDDGRVYELDHAGSATIVERNMLTGEKRTVTENCPANDKWGSPFDALIDNILPTAYTDATKGEKHTYLLDLQTGAYTEFSLTRAVFLAKEAGSVQNVSYVAAYNDLLLVHKDDREGRACVQGENSLLFFTVPYPVYAFITKDDYFNSRPNYIEITQVG